MKLRVHNRKLIFLFLYQNMLCPYSKELYQWDTYSLSTRNIMLKIIDCKKVFTTLCCKNYLYHLNLALLKDVPIYVLISWHVLMV